MNYQENLTHPLQSNYIELIRTVEITGAQGEKKSTYAYIRPSRFRRMTGGTETNDNKKVCSKKIKLSNKAEFSFNLQVRVYADMCGDLFHFGHSEFLARTIEEVAKKLKTTPYFVEVVVGYVILNSFTDFFV